MAEIILSESLDLKIPWRPEQYEEARHIVPVGCFGVFVTARRANPLPRWPNDIHGCIGYWNSDYKEESREFVLKKACEVGYQAFWEDERGLEFHRSILQEPDSLCEVDFLMLPVYQVNAETGTIEENRKSFDNSVYGLLVESPNGQKATYLPNVFPRMSWQKLKNHLLKKAGISSGKFYAYRIRQIQMPIGSVCNSKAISLCLQDNFKRMLYQHHRPSYPYFPLHYRNNSFEFDSSEEVRNTGLLLDLVEANQKGVFFTKKQSSFLHSSIENTARRPLSDQAKAFLLPSLKYLQYDTFDLCSELGSKLFLMERAFQFGETIVGMKKSGCQVQPKYILPFLLKSYPLENPDDIFQINWDCQALRALNVKEVPKKVMDSLLKVLQAISIQETTFTNVLAVSWECIQTIYPLCSVYYKKRLDAYRLYCCWLLQQRVDETYPTIYLMLQGDARLDITSHVLGGWKIEDI